MAHTEAHITFDTLSDATTVGTGTATDGTGNFDELMQVVTLHLEKQFTDGRITGTDYANVYLGALQSTLDQAVGFTLGMNKANADADLVGKQEELVTQQKLTEVQNTSLVTNRAATELKQALDVEAATSLKGAQEDLVDNQAATELKRALDLVSSTSVRNDQSSADTTLKTAQGNKLGADKDLVNEQKSRITNEKNKIDAEITLLGKKGTTEDKQILVMNEQIDLFKEQAKGFKWNAENKYLKALLDAYAINVSVSKEDDTDTPMLQGGSDSGSIRGVIDDMKPTG